MVWGVLPNIQDKNNRKVDKGMDSLKSTVSVLARYHATGTEGYGPGLDEFV